MSKNRGYFVKEKGAEWGIPIVATSDREAKRLAFGASEMDCDWIDLRCDTTKWIDDRAGTKSTVQQNISRSYKEWNIKHRR